MNSELIEKRKQAQAINEPILRDKTLEKLLEIVKGKAPKSILEVGTSFGLTGVAMLLENGKARLTGIEISEEKVKIAKENYKHFGVDGRAKIFLGDATEIIPILTGNYDLILLDGPKSKYIEYLPNLLNMLNIGGIIFADDVLFHGYIKGEAPRKHNTIKHNLISYLNAVSSDERLKTEMLEIEDGVAITTKIR